MILVLPDEYEALEGMINRNEVKQTPAGTDDDEFIIQAAKEFGAVIVSNDRYREYEEAEPWLKSRCLRFSIVRGKVLFYTQNQERTTRKTANMKTAKDSRKQQEKTPQKEGGSTTTTPPAVQIDAAELARLQEPQERILQTLAAAENSPEMRQLSAIGKRVLARGLAKDICSVIEILETVPGLPGRFQQRIAETKAFLEEKLAIIEDETVDPDMWWEQLPMAVRRVEALLEELAELAKTSSEQSSSNRKTPQTA
ncbi:MAG: hypothetical protein ACFFB3_12210 [Candidatus Hodarchaeota archaeon]